MSKELNGRPADCSKVTQVENHARYDAKEEANELTQINTLVSEQWYYDLG